MVRGALDGVRIVEFGQLIAIPFATKLLSDMGAEVIRVESCTRLELYRASGFYDNDTSGEWWNRSVHFYEQNRNKLSLTLDLTQPEGRSALLELVSVSDVFAENFTPRVIKNFGLEYEDLRKVRPDIIMVSSTGYGHTGPWSGFGAIGFGTEAASGLSSVTGYKDGPPAIPEIPYSDFTAGEHTAFAIMAALVHRAATGQGQFIDISQTQTLSATVPEALMDYSFNGRTPAPSGNRDDNYQIQGTYPCRGSDKWISITIRSDSEWESLCGVLGAGRVAGGRAVCRLRGAQAEPRPDRRPDRGQHSESRQRWSFSPRCKPRGCRQERRWTARHCCSTSTLRSEDFMRWWSIRQGWECRDSPTPAVRGSSQVRRGRYGARPRNLESTIGPFSWTCWGCRRIGSAHWRRRG